MLMNWYLWIVILMFLSGVWIYCSKRKHLLIMLLSLEYLVLSLFFLMLMYFSSMKYEMFMLMIYLVFVVCEGVLGLGILILMIRSFGNDYMQSISILRC